MRDLREEDRVRLAVDEAEDRWERAFDVWQSVTWTIMMDPTCGRAVNATGTVRDYVWHGARSNGMPSVEVIYTIENDDLIVIEWAEFKDAPYHYHGTG